MTGVRTGADYLSMRLPTSGLLHVVALAAFAASACDRAPRPTDDDTTALLPPALAGDTATTVAGPNGWSPDAGPALIVSGEAQSAAVVFPQASGALSDTLRFDDAAIADARVALFSRTGLVGQGTIAAGFDSSAAECVGWPRVRVIPDDQVPPGATWTVALLAGHATALPADSIGAMSRADSARYTRAVLRLASMIPSDRSQPFHGLPFSVRSVFRFRPEPSVDALVSDVVRRISTEANPREEHTLIVAERDTASSARFELVYHERAAGPEETVVASDALAMLLVGPAQRPTVVLSRDDGSGTVYALLERTGPEAWRVRWNSAHSSC